MNQKVKYQSFIGLFVICSTILAIALLAGAEQRATSVELQTGFYYTVQEGDTLWDLSQKFSDSPWQWPTLWEENSQIANPHRIYPGDKIRLFRRKDAQGIAIKDKDSGEGKDKLPAPGLSDDLPHFVYTGIDRVGFIRKKPVESHGAIFKVEQRKSMISVGDVVYVRPQKNFIFTPGRRYTVYRTLKTIRDRNTNDYIGIQHYLTGVIEVTRAEPRYIRAKVVSAYRPIEIEDLLMPYDRRLPEIKLRESVKGLEGMIIESEEHRRLIGDETIAFIDKGEQDGIKPGQFYNVYYQVKDYIDPKRRDKELLAPVDYGELLVIHTEKTTSTVLITHTQQDISPGTRIRTPEG